MQLKPFEAGRYDDDNIIIGNPDNSKQELFTEAEFEIVKFLKKNEQETLLALLLPNIGIAKKNHIVVCLKVLGKLKRMQIVDYFTITGRHPLSDTGTLELRMPKSSLELHGLNSFAAVLFALVEKLAWMGALSLLLLTLGLAAFAFLAFPFAGLEMAYQQTGVPYGSFFLLLYLVSCGAFSFRALLQAAFLRTLGRQSRYPVFSFFGPFLCLDADRRDVNLAGYRARVQVALVGLLAPFAFGALFTALVLFGWLSPPLGFAAFVGCGLVTLILACPFFSFDLADILHVTFLRDELHERIADGLRKISQAKGSLSREMLFSLCATLVWLLVWLDSLRSVWDILANDVVADLFAPPTLLEQMGAGLLLLLLVSLLMMPASVFLATFVQERFRSPKKRLVVEKDKIKESLTFEERMAALENIPLFAYLNDQERLSLLNEMHPVFQKHGEFLVHQGEVGKEFYVLVKGHAAAYFTDMQGRNYLLADLREGDAFGEISLIDDVPRTASIVSDGGCLALVLEKTGFDRFAHSLGSPDRVKAMIRLTSFFRRHPLFSKLNAKDQADLIDNFRFHTITAGEEIPENDESFYVIYSGSVRADTGDDSTDILLTPDDSFGYTNALGAKFFAAEGTGLLSVRKSEFHTLIWAKLVERPELFV